MINSMVKATVILLLTGLFESHSLAANESKEANSTPVVIQINSKADSLIQSLPGMDRLRLMLRVSGQRVFYPHNPARQLYPTAIMLSL